MSLALQHGLTHLHEGRIEEARMAFAAAVAAEPANALAYQLLGIAQMQSGMAEEGLVNLARAVDLAPADAGARGNFAGGLMAKGRLREALGAYEEALALDPGLVDAWRARGEILAHLGQAAEAAASFEQAIGLGADDAGILSDYGNALAGAGRYEAALQAFERALARDPNHAVAWTNRGAVLCRLDRHEEAVETMSKAIALEPRHAPYRFNRGATLLELARIDEALADLEAAMALAPNFPNARLSAAFAHFAAGRFEPAWPLYEARWAVSHVRPPLAYFAPFWGGRESLQGRTILLRAEQGLGDTIQFSRYAERLQARGAKVVLHVQPPLLRLMRTLPGVDVLAAQGEAAPGADHQAFLMSLPLALGEPEPYAPPGPYLFAEPDKVAAWRARLGVASRPRIGLCWAGGTRGDPRLDWINRRRDLPLDCLRALKDAPVDFVSLQKGEPAEGDFRRALASDWDGPPILDVSDTLEDFSDTAALIETLDVVISVDTAVAHLAGALGKPVWLLNRFDSCWRWIAGRDDSPWYPSLTLYRQTRLGEWDSVLARVRTDLNGLAPGSGGR